VNMFKNKNIVFDKQFGFFETIFNFTVECFIRAKLDLLKYSRMTNLEHFRSVNKSDKY